MQLLVDENKTKKIVMVDKNHELLAVYTKFILTIKKKKTKQGPSTVAMVSLSQEFKSGLIFRSQPVQASTVY